MRTSMFLATIAAVGTASVGCAQGSRQATYRTGAAPVAVAPRQAPAPRPAPAPYARSTSPGTVVLSSRPVSARVVPDAGSACALPAPVFARAPVAPSAPASPLPVAPAPQPVAAAPSPVFAPSGFEPATAGFGASGRPVNATCPVMLGNPVDPAVTAVFQGRVIAFSDYTARWKWNTEPERYAVNLPRSASGSSSDTIPVPSMGGSGPVFATRTNEPLPLDPTLPSFETLPPARSAPVLPPPSQLPVANVAVTSPRAMPPLVPRTPAPVEKGPVAKGPTLKLPGATMPALPPAETAPSLLDPAHGEDEECPGGNCRLPGR